jgi:hypothetical protein
MTATCDRCAEGVLCDARLRYGPGSHRDKDEESEEREIMDALQNYKKFVLLTATAIALGACGGSQTPTPGPYSNELLNTLSQHPPMGEPVPGTAGASSESTQPPPPPPPPPSEPDVIEVDATPPPMDAASAPDAGRRGRTAPARDGGGAARPPARRDGGR